MFIMLCDIKGDELRSGTILEDLIYGNLLFMYVRWKVGGFYSRRD